MPGLRTQLTAVVLVAAYVAISVKFSELVPDAYMVGGCVQRAPSCH